MQCGCTSQAFQTGKYLENYSLSLSGEDKEGLAPSATARRQLAEGLRQHEELSTSQALPHSSSIPQCHQTRSANQHKQAPRHSDIQALQTQATCKASQNPASTLCLENWENAEGEKKGSRMVKRTQTKHSSCCCGHARSPFPPTH